MTTDEIVTLIVVAAACVWWLLARYSRTSVTQPMDVTQPAEVTPSTEVTQSTDVTHFHFMDHQASAHHTTQGITSTYVQLAPGDAGDGLPAAIFEDPKTYQPIPGSRGQVHAWGMFDYDEDNIPLIDGNESMLRQMRYQTLYMRSGNPPQRQWIDVIMKRKLERLSRVNLNVLNKQDVVLNMKLCLVDKEGQLRIRRRIRVSAGMKLSVFQDKVLTPVMGWVRNYHCYLFTDYRDGALFGPQKSSAVDRMHMMHIGWDFLPDDEYTLAHLFTKKGDTFGYLYDLGDQWLHEITVERIFAPDLSTGEVTIIDGKGMCPGENMGGCSDYGQFLEQYDQAPFNQKERFKRKILNAANYSTFGKHPSVFDPDHFDLAEADARLKDALGSANSVKSGAKSFNIPIIPGSMEIGDQLKRMHLQKGEKIVKGFNQEEFGYWEETINTRRDKRDESLCAQCGRSGERLRVCGGCKQTRYCSVEHQKEHWGTTHKGQCSRKYKK